MPRRVLFVEAEPTLEVKLVEYLADRKVNGVCEKTLSTYEGKLDICFKETDKKTKITKVDWNSIIASIYDRDISDASKESYLSSLRNFMRWLDIGLKIPKVKHVETMKEPYTDAEIRKLIAKPKSKKYVEWSTWASVLILVDTGIRASSLRNLKKVDVDLNNCVINIRHTKTRKVQVLPISITTRNALKTLWKNSDDEYAITDAFGQMMSENCLRLRIERYNRARGVAKTSIHLFRHYFAKSFLMNGGNAIMLQKFLGHSTMDMSAHYADIYGGDLVQMFQSNVERLHKNRKGSIC